jgi:hypothetical protein
VSSYDYAQCYTDSVQAFFKLKIMGGEASYIGINTVFSIELLRIV